jgi:hypothetical protein
MKIAEYIETYREEIWTPAVRCKDGFRMSVQASEGHYCSPRSNECAYTEVEVGYPSEVEPLLTPYAEGDDLTNTIYGYVPVEVVEAVIAKHGGMYLPCQVIVEVRS